MRELGDQEQVSETNPKHRANKSNYPLRDRVRDSEQSVIGESRPPIEPIELPCRIVEDLETVVVLLGVVGHERIKLPRSATSIEISVRIRCGISGANVKET